MKKGMEGDKNSCDSSEKREQEKETDVTLTKENDNNE